MLIPSPPGAQPVRRRRLLQLGLLSALLSLLPRRRRHACPRRRRGAAPPLGWLGHC